MSQPPLTAAIQNLEDRLGVLLFDRSVKGMRLTLAGIALAEEARSILGHLRRAERIVMEAGGQARPLSVGFVSAALTTVLPTLLQHLKACDEPLPQLHEMTTPEQIEALADARIDLGFLHPPIPSIAGLECFSLAKDPFWLMTSSDHRLARRSSIRFAEVADEPMVLFPERQGPVLYETIRMLIADAGGQLRIGAEAQRTHSQLAMVSAGLGVGLITRSVAKSLLFQGVVTIPIEDTADRLFLELSLVAEPNRAAAVIGALRGSTV